MRTKHTFRLPPDLASKLADYATRKRVAQALIVEAALASHLSPDGADRLEAALARRLNRMTRHLERIERHVDISNEALAVFVRFWLTSATPPLPDTALAAAQIKGRERYDGFVEALGRRLARGRKLADEVSRDVDAVAPESDARAPIVATLNFSSRPLRDLEKVSLQVTSIAISVSICWCEIAHRQCGCLDYQSAQHNLQLARVVRTVTEAFITLLEKAPCVGVLVVERAMPPIDLPLVIAPHHLSIRQPRA